MKTEMRYRNQNGVVGQYRGENVFVIGYKDFYQPAPNDHTIYAVRIDDGHQKDWLDLVQGSKFIGTMTDSGHVEIYDASRRREYKFYTEPVIKEAAPEPESEPITDVLNTEYGYGEFSRVVDDFFKGLDKLWDELEV